jgi:hypothetical protein
MHNAQHTLAKQLDAAGAVPHGIETYSDSAPESLYAFNALYVYAFVNSVVVVAEAEAR